MVLQPEVAKDAVQQVAAYLADRWASSSESGESVLDLSRGHLSARKHSEPGIYYRIPSRYGVTFWRAP